MTSPVDREGLVEMLAWAILNRRVKGDWRLKVGDHWAIDHDKELALSALAELDAAGLVICPKAPTEEQVKAACKEFDAHGYYYTRGYVNEGHAEQAYGAMLSASPFKDSSK